MTKFYHLHAPDENDFVTTLYGESEWASEYKFAEWSDNTHKALGSIVCPINPEHNRAADRNFNLHLIIPTQNLKDFIWTWLDECVITDRLLTMLTQANFTGFDVRAVTVESRMCDRDSLTENPPKLWEMVVVGKGGNPLPKSGIKLIFKCDACGLQRFSSYTDGIHIDSNQWDGTDFFNINGYPKLIFVSERVKDFILSNKLKNCYLISSQNMSWPQGVIKPEEIYPLLQSND